MIINNLVYFDKQMKKIYYKMILSYNTYMTTLSVPLPSHLEELVKKLAKQRGSNKAEVVRHALELLAEEEAVQAVLTAERELSEGKLLKGDLQKLAKKLS